MKVTIKKDSVLAPGVRGGNTRQQISLCPEVFEPFDCPIKNLITEDGRLQFHLDNWTGSVSHRNSHDVSYPLAAISFRFSLQ